METTWEFGRRSWPRSWRGAAINTSGLGSGVLFSLAPGLLWPSPSQPRQTSGLSVPPVCLSCHLLPVSSVLWASAQMSTRSFSPRPLGCARGTLPSPPSNYLLRAPPYCSLTSFSRPYHPGCDLPSLCMPLRTDGPGQASHDAPRTVHSFTYALTASLAPPFPLSLPPALIL